MSNKTVTVKVDSNLCIGAAACVAAAPKFFVLDEDNFAAILNPATGQQAGTLTFEATEEDQQLLREAALNCPTSAITVE